MTKKLTFLTATGVYPNSLGGPAVHLYCLNSGLRERGVDSQVFDFSTLRKSSIFREFLTASQHLATSDVVVFNSPPVGLLFLMLCFSKLLMKRTIYVCHGGVFYEVNGFLNKLFRAMLLFQLEKRLIDYVIVPSRWLAKFISRYRIKSTLIVIPNGVDIHKVDSIRPQEITTKRNILFAGRLAKVKGITELVQAFSLLDGNAYNLYIVGPNQELSQNQISKIQRIPGVHVLGEMKHETTLSLMKSVNLVVAPSLMENFPLSVLEAMACGKPVIATKVGGIPEIIENGYNGILIPPKNIDALAKAISFLIENPTQAVKLGHAARRTIKEQFTLNIMIQKYLSVIEDNYTNVRSSDVNRARCTLAR